MLYIRTTPGTNKTLGSGYLTIGIGREFQIATSGVIDGWFVGVDKIPVRTSQLVALELQGRLSKNYTYGVLAECLIVGKGVFNLPGCVVTLI